MNPLKETLGRTVIGEPIICRNLASFPLLDGGGMPDYLTLDEALVEGVVRITEVSESGEVPHLLVANHAPRPVLLIDGEELIGAKQNRVLNLSILAPPGQSTRIPVSCVEAGRWEWMSDELDAASHLQHAFGRGLKAASVSRALRTGDGRRSDQHRIWADIGAKQARMGIDSMSSAMNELYESRAKALDAFMATMKPVPAQCGAVFLVGGAVAGLDLFDCAPTFSKLFPKLVRSYALDALDALDAESVPTAQIPVPDRTSAEHFLDALGQTPIERFSALGLGEDVRIGSAAIAGGALVHMGRIVHLCAFPVHEMREQEFPRASFRMRAWERR